MIRPIPAPPRRDQRGAAVISALIIVAIVAALTPACSSARPPACAGWRTSSRACRPHAAGRRHRLGAAGGARPRQARGGHAQGPDLGHPILDTRIERPGDERVAVFSGGLEDEQGKYNLYNLARAACRSRPRNRCCCGCWACCACRTRWRRASSTSWPWASRRRSPPKPAQPARARARAAWNRARPGSAVRDELQRTMTLLPANTQVNVNTAPPKSSPRWHPACRSARPAPSPASATGAMPSTIAATSPTAWRAPASGHAARRRHRQRLVHGARRGGLRTRPSHRAGAAARHARPRPRPSG